MKNTPDITSASWLRLAEYGDWPHPRGLQRFTPCAANTMVQYFRSLRGRLARKFGGLPVYIGHPDDAQFSGQSGHTDTRAYAWVTDLEARRDGLYGAFKWSAAGEELLRNAFYKFLSPRWAMEPLGTDTFQPVRLLSVGLTNQPNIPGEAIANSSPADSAAAAANPPAPTIPSPDAEAQPDGVLPSDKNAQQNNDARQNQDAQQNSDSQQDSDTQQDSEASRNTDAQQNDSAQVTYGELRTALGIGAEVDPLEAIGELREQSERFYRIACEQVDRIGHESASLANARREQIDLVVQNALLSGRIAPHEAANWRQNFEADWDSAHNALNARGHTLKTTAIANTRSPGAAIANSTDDFLARVEAHAKANGLNFAQAWCDLKRRQPDLYRQFFTSDN